MVSSIQICNRAIIKVHATPISSFSGDSEEAVSCNILYPQVRDEVLQAHPWNFAVKQELLQQDTATPLFEFNYQYTLPADCLRVLKIDSSNYRYKIKGRQIHTDASSVNVEYIKQETDTTKFSPLFVAALATRLAAELAYSLAGSGDLKTLLLQEYDEIFREAKRRDGQEGIPDDLTADTWVDSRSGFNSDWTMV